MCVQHMFGGGVFSGGLKKSDIIHYNDNNIE